MASSMLSPETPADKVPFIVTVLLAAIGWAVTHTVDRLQATPTVEYTGANLRSLTGPTSNLPLRRPRRLGVTNGSFHCVGCCVECPL